MSPVYLGVAVLHQGFPRVSGDEPITKQCCACAGWFSPRERG